MLFICLDYLSVYIYIYIYICVEREIYTHIVYIYMYTYYVCLYIYICTYTYIYIYICMFLLFTCLQEAVRIRRSDRALCRRRCAVAKTCVCVYLSVTLLCYFVVVIVLCSCSWLCIVCMFVVFRCAVAKVKEETVLAADAPSGSVSEKRTYVAEALPWTEVVLPAAVRCDMVLHQAFRARLVRKQSASAVRCDMVLHRAFRARRPTQN